METPMVSNKRQRPFSKEYVLNKTSERMLLAIDISIHKTFERSKEFADDHEKSNEVFKTLTLLHSMRNMVNDFNKLN